MTKTGKNAWLEYDWRVDGSDARFCVDMSLYAKAPVESSTELVFVYFASPSEKPLKAGEMRRVEGLVARCVKKLGKDYVGCIQTAAMQQYYFYTDSEEKYSALQQLFQKERRLTVKLGCKHEPKWTTYYKLLYPDAAKLQTVRNKENIEKLYSNGDSEAARRLNLHMYFRSEPLRLQFEEAARREGFAIGSAVDRELSELPYGVVLHKICPLKKRDVDEITVHAIRIAEQFGGRLMFWDCPLAPQSLK